MVKVSHPHPLHEVWAHTCEHMAHVGAILQAAGSRLFCLIGAALDMHVHVPIEVPYHTTGYINRSACYLIESLCKSTSPDPNKLGRLVL